MPGMRILKIWLGNLGLLSLGFKSYQTLRVQHSHGHLQVDVLYDHCAHVAHVKVKVHAENDMPSRLSKLHIPSIHLQFYGHVELGSGTLGFSVLVWIQEQSEH